VIDPASVRGVSANRANGWSTLQPSKRMVPMLDKKIGLCNSL